MNAAVTCAFLGVVIVEKLLPMIRSSDLLRLHYWAAAMIAGALVVQSTLPQTDFIEPVAKVWSVPSTQLPEGEARLQIGADGYLSFASHASSHSVTAIGSILVVLALASLLIGLLHLTRSVTSLRHVMGSAYLIRRAGRVRIWSSDDVIVPFSYWTPRGAHVVVPASCIVDPRAYRMIVAHEVQHHRQSDTLWLYVFGALRLMCIANPFAHLWSRRVSLAQELACDETVMGRHRWSVKSYGDCLLDVAMRAGGRRTHIVSAAALLGANGSCTLKTRMENLLRSKESRSRGFVRGFAVAFFAILTLASYAAGNWVQDRRITLEQAQQLAERMDLNSGFPVVVNEAVLRELNRYAGSMQGREFMRASMLRLDTYRNVVSAAFDRHELPEALIAMPIVESGYQNLTQAKNKSQSAGIWQVIPQTARAYGLRVDSQVDDRLDPVLLTHAAARLLKTEYLHFGDWNLAVLAYNMGRTQVQNAIASTGSNDAWRLVGAGTEENKAYLARVHAAALIIANPTLIN
jgi:beta-lactamase regulating signal transducer with metallopeptidase domain